MILDLEFYKLLLAGFQHFAAPHQDMVSVCVRNEL